MNFGNLNKMQNTQLNEDNEEGRAISEYDEYLKKIAKNDFPSTKSKDCTVKIPNECKLIKKDETGYNDAHYFSYIFKKNVGMTPSEYRQQNQNQLW